MIDTQQQYINLNIRGEIYKKVSNKCIDFQIALRGVGRMDRKWGGG